jgi:hypothetical protein
MLSKSDGKDTDETGDTASIAATVVARRMQRGNVLFPIAESFANKEKLWTEWMRQHKQPMLLKGDSSKHDD